MAFKPRVKPLNLIIYEFLEFRKILSEEEQQTYYYLKKGYEGEVLFDELTEKLEPEVLVLNDLLLEWGDNEFQVDSSIIAQPKLFVFEVKNFEGEHYFKDDKFIKVKYGKEKTNPLHQLNRKVNLLNQLLKKYGFSIPIEPYLVFVNPEFTLLQAPLHSNIILPTQLNQFMKKLNSMKSNLNGWHTKIAQFLVASHKTESRHAKRPDYQYDDLDKKLPCAMCGEGEHEVKLGKVICKKCKHEEIIESAVMRLVKELQVLFPGMRITTSLLFDWCGKIFSKKVICRILMKYMKVIGTGRWVYFENKGDHLEKEDNTST